MFDYFSRLCIANASALISLYFRSLFTPFFLSLGLHGEVTPVWHQSRAPNREPGPHGAGGLPSARALRGRFGHGQRLLSRWGPTAPFHAYTPPECFYYKRRSCSCSSRVKCAAPFSACKVLEVLCLFAVHQCERTPRCSVTSAGISLRGSAVRHAFLNCMCACMVLITNQIPIKCSVVAMLCIFPAQYQLASQAEAAVQPSGTKGGSKSNGSSGSASSSSAITTEHTAFLANLPFTITETSLRNWLVETNPLLKEDQLARVRLMH